MKFILKLGVLIIPVLFALAIGASRCPLYFKDETVRIGKGYRKPINGAFPVLKLLRTNGLIKFQIGTDIVYAPSIQAAARKFAKKFKAIAVRLLTNDDDGQMYVEVTY